VFVAVYQRALALSLMYVDDLLQRIKDDFGPVYKPGTADCPRPAGVEARAASSPLPAAAAAAQSRV
jgi:hypothetical protein